jgi:hypothetical protein
MVELLFADRVARHDGRRPGRDDAEEEGRRLALLAAEEDVTVDAPLIDDVVGFVEAQQMVVPADDEVRLAHPLRSCALAVRQLRGLGHSSSRWPRWSWSLHSSSLRIFEHDVVLAHRLRLLDVALGNHRHLALAETNDLRRETDDRFPDTILLFEETKVRFHETLRAFERGVALVLQAIELVLIGLVKSLIGAMASRSPVSVGFLLPSFRRTPAEVAVRSSRRPSASRAHRARSTSP